MSRQQEVISAGIRMLSEGVTIGTWGNISVRDRDTGKIYITPSGMPYNTLKEEDICVLNENGDMIEGFRKPSIETGAHLAVYRARPDALAIVHTHPVYSTAFSSAGEGIPLFLDEAAQILMEPVQVADYALPGSDELAANCVKALGSRGMACLMKSHGALCVGDTLDRAFLVSSVLEATARILWIQRSMGLQYDPISESDIRAMQDFVKNKYGQR